MRHRIALALALVNQAARAANWLLDTQLDERVCRLSNQLSGEER